ncbi:unnamed protein product [Parascedosporium putredinis]|uniref:Uncharacterized protein n=1 Tax=Parascedosporium putredinis TaxID=1442378 RepID=A0A9P1H9J9_9PEZI|nr:unnamed protein product [Parascedosporium putredinis]CAI8001794.1 unnamed protein product [Parascedosporium putredinis]
MEPLDYPRLDMSTPARLGIASLGAFGLGMTLGGAHGGKVAQLRFRAEHAHKMPTTTTDWYFYHRSKNYHAAYGGLKEGFKMGSKLGFWAFAMIWLEHTVDRLWNRFPLTTAARTTKQALAFGLIFGGLQDGLGLLRGQPISYVEFAKRRLGKSPARPAAEKT